MSDIEQINAIENTPVAGERERQLAEIRARYEASTPGEWFDDGEKTIGSSCLVSQGNIRPFIAHVVSSDNDTQFIAHAHQDVPWLLAEIEWLEQIPAAVADHATETFIVESFDGEEYVSLGYHWRFVALLIGVVKQ